MEELDPKLETFGVGIEVHTVVQNHNRMRLKAGEVLEDEFQLDRPSKSVVLRVKNGRRADYAVSLSLWSASRSAGGCGHGFLLNRKTPLDKPSKAIPSGVKLNAIKT